jgi:hypothetical protein
MPRILPAFVLVLVLVLLPAAVFAQEFSPLASGLKVGQRVYLVVDAPCTESGCGGEFVDGRILELTPSSIVIKDGAGRHDLRLLDVRRVERHGDRIWNGILAGFGVGFGAGFLTVIADSCDSNEWCPFSGPEFAAAFGLLTGAVGAGIGAITDALISGRRVVFDRPAGGQRGVTIAPILAPRHAGVSISLRF